MTTLRKINSLALMCMIVSAPAFSYDDEFDYVGDSNQDSLSVDQMDIDGVYRKRRSQADKLERARKQLERRNENLVRQKIEDARIREEKKMTNKLQKMFKRNSLRNSSDQNYVDQAPVKYQQPKQHIQEKIVYQPAKSYETPKFKVIPSVGFMVVNNDNVTFDSSSQFALTFESVIANRFSLGLGLGHGKVDIKSLPNSYGGFGSFNSFFNVRDLKYRRTTIDLVGKFFIVPDSKVNPYVGLALGFARDKLNYDDNNNSFNNNFGGFNNNNFDENYRRNYGTYAALIGAEVKFSRNFGINAEIRHSRGFGSSDNNNQNNQISTIDQISLNAIGNDLIGASFTSINFGFIGSF